MYVNRKCHSIGRSFKIRQSPRDRRFDTHSSPYGQRHLAYRVTSLYLHRRTFVSKVRLCRGCSTAANSHDTFTGKELSDLFDFRDIYFLHQFLESIEYFSVLHSIRYRNIDRIDALLSYYILSKELNRHADQWFSGSFARYLFPKAHLVSQYG